MELATKQSLNFVLHHSIADVDSNRWNQVVKGQGVFLSIPYLTALEASSISGLSFRYVMMEKGGQPLAVFLFQVADLSYDGVGGVLNLENYGGISNAAANTVNAILFKKTEKGRPVFLVCGSLLASGEYGMVAADAVALETASRHYPEVLKLVKSSLGDVRVVVEMLKDFYEPSNMSIYQHKTAPGISLRTDPEMILDLHPDWKCFDDYLGALGSKYRIRTNGVRKSLEGLMVRELDLQEMESRQLELQTLFSAVADRAPIRIVRPQMEYLISLKRHLKHDMRFTVIQQGNQLIAFRTALISDHQLEAHFIGMDYGLNKELNLYQNILYGLVEDGISAKVSRVMYGRTALEIKSTVGARPHRLACYIRFRSRTLNAIVNVLTASLGPKDWIPRSPFK